MTHGSAMSLAEINRYFSELFHLKHEFMSSSFPPIQLILILLFEKICNSWLKETVTDTRELTNCVPFLIALLPCYLQQHQRSTKGQSTVVQVTSPMKLTGCQ